MWSEVVTLVSVDSAFEATSQGHIHEHLWVIIKLVPVI